MQKSRLPLLTLLGLSLLLAVSPASSAVVKNGQSGIEVVLDAKCPAAERDIAQVLVDQIHLRTGCAVHAADSGSPATEGVLVRIVLGAANRDGQVSTLQQSAKLQLPSQIQPEGYVIRSISDDPQTIVIAAADTRGLMFGVGRFLRSLRYYADRVEVPAIDIADQPQHRYRAEFLASHFQDTGYKDWTLAQWQSYVEDMAIWGVNQVWYLPMQFGQTFNVLDGKGTETDQRRWTIYRQVPNIVRRYGLGVGIYIGVNDIFGDEMTPEILAKPHPHLAIEQNHACPSMPEGWKRIMADREQFFKAMPGLDCCYFPTTDYGGCGCDSCMPWGKTYLKLAKAEAEIVHRYHPECMVILSTQALPFEEQKGIAEASMEKPAWANALQAFGSCGVADNPQWTPPPKQSGSVPLIIYPEITMTGGWGNYGAHVRVDDFDYNLPRQRFDEIAPAADGFFCYSEGLHDDVIKIIWAQKAWRHSQEPNDILAEYCRYYFGEEAAPSMAQAMQLMAKNWDHRANFAQADEMLRLVEQAQNVMPPWARESWRARLLKFRAFIDQAKVARRQSINQATAQRDALLHQCCKEQTLEKIRATLNAVLAAKEEINKVKKCGPFPQETQKLLDQLESDGFFRWSHMAENPANHEILSSYGFQYWANPLERGYGIVVEGDDGRLADEYVNQLVTWGVRPDATPEESRKAAWAALYGNIDAIDFLPSDLPQETLSPDGWKKGTNIPGYAGGGHLVSFGRASGKLTKHFEDVVEGEYSFWVRDNNHQGGAGANGSVRLLINGEPKAVFGDDAANHDTWTWKCLGHLKLPAGSVDLTLEDFGDGCSVTDGFCITPDASYRPDGKISP